jgi:hypothetical protein
MSSVYRVISQRCKDALVNNKRECIIDVPISSIDLHYTLQGLYDYIKMSFPDYKVRFLETSNQLKLTFRNTSVGTPSKQDFLQFQTKKILEQYPGIKTVEYIQVGNEYRKKRRTRKTV